MSKLKPANACRLNSVPDFAKAARCAAPRYAPALSEYRLCAVLEQSVTRGPRKHDKAWPLFTTAPLPPIGMELVLLAYVDAASGRPMRPSCSADATSHALAPVRAAAVRSSRSRMPPAPIT